ncbi:hypothetical protein MJM45_28900, partial [Salmonella enterica subsp. enterica serovar Kentucky]|nr:hypothetical protein [Salmonella enterica subsp. enterica serovar Kentucky]
IKQALDKQGISAGANEKSLTVGTVHSLQGAERAIVIFSPVYSSDITGETLGISEVNGHSLVRLSARTGEGVDVLRIHLKQSMGF